MGWVRIGMDLAEALTLLDAISVFHFEASEDKPRFTIYDNQKGGYDLLVKAQTGGEKYRSRLRKIVKSRRLFIRESDGCLVITGR
jgi:hypothetical protein